MSANEKVFYSASRGGFFSPALHADMPQDAVGVSPQRHAALLAGQSNGHEIVPDKRGRPTLRSLQPHTLAQAQAAAVSEVKREAARRIEGRMPLWRQVNALRDSSDPGFHEIDSIRAASNLIEQAIAEVTTIAALASFPIADNPIWPVFDKG